MKKIFVIFTLFCLLLSSTTAFAITTSKDDLLTILSLIEARVEDGFDLIELGEEVVCENHVTFSIDNVYYQDSEIEGMMDALYFMSVNLDSSDFGIADFGFGLLSRDGNSQYTYHTADHVYGITNGLVQEYMWPVVTPETESIEIVMLFTIPKDTKVLDMVFSNIMGNGEGDYEPTGNLKVYTKYRTPMDFNFTNSSGKTITEIYVAPSSDSSWGKNLLALYEEPTLADGIWMEITFKDTDLEDRTGENWELRVDYEDGTHSTFSDIDLDDIIELELVPSAEEDQFALNVTR